MANRNDAVLITGAASGIGRAAVAAFAARGRAVLAVDLDVGGLAETQAAAGEESCAVFAADLADPNAAQAMYAAALEAGLRLQAVVHCAGIGEPPTASFAQQTLANYTQVMDINVRAVWLSMQQAALVLPRGGAIVNVASVAGLVGFPSPLYTASKHAVVGLTKAAALLLAPQGVRVNAVCPGAVETPLLERFIAGDASRREWLQQRHPAGRLGTPEDVAAALVWLAAPDSSWITGATLAVDGGYTAQ